MGDLGPCVRRSEPNEGRNVLGAIALFGLPVTNPTLRDGRIYGCPAGAPIVGRAPRVELSSNHHLPHL
jgi:hypothetical protein